MTRERDALDRYIAQERMRSFTWGTGNGDCLLFALGWVERNGYRASVNWRGRYHDEGGARRELGNFGGAVAAVTDVLGAPSVGGPAGRGDVGLLEIEDWHLGMICTGKLWALRHGTRGVRLQLCRPGIVWRVTQ